MSRGILQDFIQDPSGNAVVGASVEVFIADGLYTTQAALWDSAVGGNSVANPMTTVERGYFSAFADTAEYDLRVTTSGGTFDIPNVPVFDADELTDLAGSVSTAVAAAAASAVSAGESATSADESEAARDEILALNPLQTVATLAELQGLTGMATDDVRDVTGIGQFQYDGAEWIPISRPIRPKMFSAAQDGVTDDLLAYRSAIALAVETGDTLDITGGPAYITDVLDFTGVAYLVSDYASQLIINPSLFVGDWVATFGDPDQTALLGRAPSFVLAGTLRAVALNRNAVKNGIYIKTAISNVGHIRAENFNGKGIWGDSVFDSTVLRVSSELCGNATTFALDLSSNGDTFNASHIMSVQCERSYQKGLNIDVLRCVIDNIHAERGGTITTAGTASNPNGTAYVTHSILCENSTVNQLVFQNETTGNMDDGTPILNEKMNIEVNLSNSAVQNMRCDSGADVFSTFSTGTIDGLICTDYYHYGLVGLYTVRRIDAEKVYTNGPLKLESGTLDTFEPLFNAANITVGSEVTINNQLNFPNNIFGDIKFIGSTVLAGIAELKAPATGYASTLFLGCRIEGIVAGAFNSRAVFRDCYIEDVDLVSQTAFKFFGGYAETFNYTGNTGFITINLECPAVTAWSTPSHISYPHGTQTNRMGAGAAYIYVNTDGGTTWAAVS